MALTNPGNTVRLHSRNAGRASVYEANMWAQKFTNGLYGGNGVLQNTPSANMGVKVGGSTANPDVVIASNPSGFKVALDLVSQQTLTLVAPASNSRIASIVAYTDDLSLNSADTTTTGNQSSCGLIVVYGSTSATPAAPSDSTIRAAITTDGATGSQACYAVIDNVTLASTTTTITQTMIDAGKFISQMNGSSIADSSISQSKIDILSGWGWEFLDKNKSTALQTDVVVDLPASKQRKYYQVIFNASVATGSSGGIGIRINGLNTNASYTRTLFTASGATSNNWQLGTSTSSIASTVNAFGVVEIMNNSIMNGFVAMSDGTVRYGSAIAVGLPNVASIAVACDAANLAIGSEIIVLGRNY